MRRANRMSFFFYEQGLSDITQAFSGVVPRDLPFIRVSTIIIPSAASLDHGLPISILFSRYMVRVTPFCRPILHLDSSLPTYQPQHFTARIFFKSQTSPPPNPSFTIVCGGSLRFLSFPHLSRQIFPSGVPKETLPKFIPPLFNE